VVIHCAGIAHQQIGQVDLKTYMQINSKATALLAKAAAQRNPDVCFIFLSSVSVYGEKKGERGKSKTEHRIREEEGCHPSSDYAFSKLDAEKRLIALSDRGILQNLVVLRLAAVYDRNWRFNLDRRILIPKGIAYVRFGSGLQKMSALARPNLVEFIVHILQSEDFCRNGGKEYSVHKSPRDSGNEDLPKSLFFNVCDAEPYDFNTIIRIYRQSGIHPKRSVIFVPLVFIWIVTRIAGAIAPVKRSWFHSCYDKLAENLVFSCEKMLQTGFRPRHTLLTILEKKKAGGRKISKG